MPEFINKKHLYKEQEAFCATFGSQTVGIYATTEKEALQKATEHFKPKKAQRHEIRISYESNRSQAGTGQD